MVFVRLPLFSLMSHSSVMILFSSLYRANNHCPLFSSFHYHIFPFIDISEGFWKSRTKRQASTSKSYRPSTSGNIVLVYWLESTYYSSPAIISLSPWYLNLIPNIPVTLWRCFFLFCQLQANNIALFYIHFFSRLSHIAHPSFFPLLPLFSSFSLDNS